MMKTLSHRSSLSPFLKHSLALVSQFLNSRIGRETMGSMGLKISSVGLTFITTILLARFLGPSEYGTFSFVFALVTLLIVPSEFGLPTLVVRETARGIANQDYARVQGIWQWTGRTTTMLSLSVVIIAVGGILFFSHDASTSRQATLLWALALAPLIALSDLRGAALQGLHRVVAGQLPEFLVSPGVFAILLGIVIFFSRSALSASNAMALNVAASAAAFGIGAWLLWRAAPLPVRHATPYFEKSAWMWSALPLAFIGGMQLINQQASILIQGLFLHDTDIGIYRVAIQVSTLAAFGLTAVNSVVSPRFAALFAQGEMDKLQQLVTTSARGILAFNMIVTFGFLLAGKFFLRLAFGNVYETAYPSLLILLAGQLVNSATGSVATLLNMTGHEQETAKGVGLAACLNILLNLLMIPLWGIAGSATATALSLIIWNIVLWRAVRKHLGINSMAFAF